MSRNQVQFQKGISLPEFFKQYGTAEQCHSALYNWRWPSGFKCPECGYAQSCKLTRGLYQCHRCHHQTSVTSRTIFEHTKLPLTTWFLGMYFLTQNKNGVSALSLKRQLGIGYNAAWRLKHKILQVMKERDDSKPLSGNIQIDDVYWGGEKRGGKRGRGAPGKIPFVAAVQTNTEGHAIAMRMTRLGGFKKDEIFNWAQQHITAGSYVVSDGLFCFRAVEKAGCNHEAIVTGGGPECVTIEAFTWVNMMIGNVKNSMRGTYHSVRGRHLPRYLAEFCYRFNRRFNLEDMIARLGYVAVQTPPMPDRLLKMAEAWG